VSDPPSGSASAAEQAALDAERNAANWTQANSDYTDENAETNWASEISWGIWAVDGSELNVLGDVAGLGVEQSRSAANLDASIASNVATDELCQVSKSHRHTGILSRRHTPAD